MSDSNKFSIVLFLKEKIGHYSFSELIRSELEGYLLWIFNGLPGILGFSLRYFIYKMLFNKLDGFCWVQPGVTFVHTNKLKIGRMFGCNSGSYINAVGGVTCGDYVLIGSNVTISSGRHPIDGKEPAVFARSCIPEPITIEDDVWIGAGAVIMPGVTLKKGTVVGANAVVTHNTDEYSVVVGAPARHIRFR